MTCNRIAKGMPILWTLTSTIKPRDDKELGPLYVGYTGNSIKPRVKYIQEKVNPTRMRSIELYFRHNKTAISKDKV